MAEHCKQIQRAGHASVRGQAANLCLLPTGSATLSRLPQLRIVLSLQLLEVTVNSSGHPGNKFQLLIAGTRRMTQQPQHLRHLIKTLALQAEIYVGIGIRGGGFDITPQEMAELVHHRPEMFHQTCIQKTIQDVILVFVTGMSKSTPLQLQS
jgi:hypothetical protein